MNKYNLDKLVKVKVSDFYPCIWYRYFEEVKKKYFWSEHIKAGVYNVFLGNTYVGKAPSYCVVKEGNVYEKPKVTLNFDSDVETIKYFDTLDEAKTFSDELTKGKNWLLN